MSVGLRYNLLASLHVLLRNLLPLSAILRQIHACLFGAGHACIMTVLHAYARAVVNACIVEDTYIHANASFMPLGTGIWAAQLADRNWEHNVCTIGLYGPQNSFSGLQDIIDGISHICCE